VADGEGEIPSLEEFTTPIIVSDEFENLPDRTQDIVHAIDMYDVNALTRDDLKDIRDQLTNLM
jgi:hypothetical protein